MTPSGIGRIAIIGTRLNSASRDLSIGTSFVFLKTAHNLSYSRD